MKRWVSGVMAVGWGLLLVGCAGGGIAGVPTPSPVPPTETRIVAPSAPGTPRPSPTEVPSPTPTVSPSPTPTASPTATKTPNPLETLRAIPGAECLPSGRPVESARLVRVIDGDTIDVELGGLIRRVRYIGINAPEREQPFYAEATEANRRLVEGKPLLLVRDVSETDRYGRLLRYVIAGKVFVNLALVREGYAQVHTAPPDVSCAAAFIKAEREARAAGRGLWGRAAPIPTRTPTRTLMPTRAPALTPTPAPTPTAGRNCHPAYPTVCIPPPPPDLDCGDIPYRNFPVDHRYGDPHRFDGDRDGIGCER